MTWFKVDDQLAMHPKVAEAGNSAMGLWVRTGAWAAGHLTNGFVPAAIARSYGTAREINALVMSGLWIEFGDGYRFHDWSMYQPSEEEVAELRRKRSEAGRKGAQARWGHSTSHSTGHSTSHSRGMASAMAGAWQTDAPSPSPSLSGSVVSHSPDVPRASQNDDRLDLDKIAAQLGTDVDWAKRVAEDVLSRGNGVTQPTRYVLAAITSEPERYRPTKGPPRIGDLCRHGMTAPCPVCAEDPR